jgi:hypothetical protein
VSGGHHQISHHQNNADKLAEYQRINLWHMEQYAYLLGKTPGLLRGRAIPARQLHGPLRCRHARWECTQSTQPPACPGGRAGGSLATGRICLRQGYTPLTNLYVGMLNRMGIPTDRFSDSTGELPGLSDPAFAGKTS